MLQDNSSLSGVMEQETISKNGASSKSQMSRGNFFRKIFFALFFASIIIIGCGNSSGKSSVSSEKKTDQIIGVWKDVTGTKPVESIKIITKERFIWTWTVDNKLVASASGTYTFDGETYIENIEFGTENMSSLFGKKSVFKIRFEGNKVYYSGTLAERTPLDEVWERME